MIKQLAAIAVAIAGVGATTTTGMAQDAQRYQLRLITGFYGQYTPPPSLPGRGGLQNVRQVFVGDPDVADIPDLSGGGRTADSPSSWNNKYVMIHAGKKPGATNILMFDDKNELLYDVTVVVSNPSSSPVLSPGYVAIHNVSQKLLGFTTYYCIPNGGCLWLKSPDGLHQDIQDFTPTYVYGNGTAVQNGPPDHR